MPAYVKKYEFTNEKMTLKKGLVLYRIRALRDFACVKKGDLGGWVQHEGNLSTDYNLAWVAGEAKVYGEAKVEDDAWISGNAQAYGNAQISEEARIEGNARIYGGATVSDGATVGDNARVYGSALISGNVKITDNAQIFGEAKIYDGATVRQKAQVCGNAVVYGDVHLFSNAEVCGEARVRYKARIGGDVIIEHTNDYMTVLPIGVDENILTLTRCGMAFGVYFGLAWDELLKECRKKGFPKLYANHYRQAVKFARGFFGKASHRSKKAHAETNDNEPWWCHAIQQKHRWIPEQPRMTTGAFSFLYPISINADLNQHSQTTIIR
jgi:carbonic anhydrase/acetyltransferase-like protein (isoleucine patch superfamily)